MQSGRAVPGVLAAGALVVATAAEAALRRLEPELAVRPLVWHDRVAQHKALQMAARRAQGDTGGHVVIGNSMALVGVDPVAWSTAAGLTGPAYNAALHRGVPTVTERWCREEVLPTLQPATVLYGVDVLDFNDHGLFHEKITRRYDTAPRTGRSGLARLRAEVLRRSAVARLAPVLTQPRVIAGGVLRALDLKDPARPTRSDLVDEHGWGCEFDTTSEYRHTENADGWLRTSILVDFAFGGVQTAAFERTLEQLRRRGIHTSAALLPVTDDFVTAMPGGERRYREVVHHIESVCRRNDVDLIDVTPAFADGGASDRWFADSFHLNGEGARRFSRLVGESAR